MPPPIRPDITEPCRVRFAPSPTGSLHVGGARTALFNWLIARKTGGTFVLRMEDTDRERSTPESEAEILRVLRWLGLDWDEGPYRQSERDDVYRDAIVRLREVGAVYAAYETAEELKPSARRPVSDKRAPVVRCKREYTEAELAAFAAEGRSPGLALRGAGRGARRSSRTWCVARSRSTTATSRTSSSPAPTTRPPTTWPRRSTMSDMKISHVIRGEDHISNTPKQMLVIRALGVEPPQYAHIPLILGPDKKRLSKRHGAASVEEFEADGFLAEPLVNSLALIGWSYDDKTERFTLAELVQAFSIARVSKGGAVFDQRKTEVMHGRYLRMMDPQAFEDALVEYLTNTGFIADNGGAEAEARVRRSAKAVKGKISKLSEYHAAGRLDVRRSRLEPEAWDKVDGRRQALHPGDRRRPGPARSAAGVGASGHQGRAAGSAAHPGRERP